MHSTWKLLHEKHDVAERLFRNIALDLAALVEAVPRMAASWMSKGKPSQTPLVKKATPTLQKSPIKKSQSTRAAPAERVEERETAASPDLVRAQSAHHHDSVVTRSPMRDLDADAELEPLNAPADDIENKTTDRELQVEFSLGRDQSILQEVVCLVKRRRWATARVFLTEHFM